MSSHTIQTQNLDLVKKEYLHDTTASSGQEPPFKTQFKRGGTLNISEHT